MSNRDYPLMRIPESEHSNTNIIEDLLNGLSEWRSVQDIVRLSIKALADNIKSHSNNIKELQYSQNEFALKSETGSSLAMKANLSDLSRAVAETRSSLDSKVSYEEVRALIEDRVTRNDLIHLLQGKVSIEEFRTAIDFKVDVKEMQNEIRTLRMSIEELKNNTACSLQLCASSKDFQNLQRVLDTKANLSEVNAALNEKATKTSVANALHKKANKADVEEMISEKANLSTVNSLNNALEHKVGISNFNMLASELEKKADLAYVEKSLLNELFHKASKNDLDQLFDTMNNLKKDLEIKLSQQSIIFANHLNELKSANDMNKLTLSSAIEKKAEFRDIEKISEILLRKSDSEELQYMFSNLKSENSSILSSQQALFKQEIKRIEAQLQEQLSSLEKRSHYYEGEQSAIKDLLKNNSEKYKQELDEYVKFFENLKNEETKSIRYDLEKLQREVENSKSKKNEKTSVFSLKED